MKRNRLDDEGIVIANLGGSEELRCLRSTSGGGVVVHRAVLSAAFAFALCVLFVSGTAALAQPGRRDRPSSGAPSPPPASSPPRRPAARTGTTPSAAGGRAAVEGASAARPLTLMTYDFEVPSVNAKGVVTRTRRQQARYFSENLSDGVLLEMVEVPGGTFRMGIDSARAEQIAAEHQRFCTTDECRRAGAAYVQAETPPRPVTVPGFLMSKYEVTQAQWQAVALMPQVNRRLPANPSKFKDESGNRPVEMISWEDAVEFCARLSLKTKRHYRLPTEAEWEYAARGGTTTEFAFGDSINTDLVNYDGNYPYGEAAKGIYRASTRAVGLVRHAANGFGLYDMHGNVSEWCRDAWHDTYQGAPTDAREWEGGGRGSRAERVARGGAWDDHASRNRSAARHKWPAYSRVITVGLRVVLDDERSAGAR